MIRARQEKWITAWNNGEPEKGNIAARGVADDNGEVFAEAKDRSQWPEPAGSLTFYSDCLHLPWNLMYPPLEFNTYRELGFLGLAFSSEDTSDFRNPRSTSKKRWGAASPGDGLGRPFKVRRTQHQSCRALRITRVHFCFCWKEGSRRNHVFLLPHE
jgi:hypothetical protein